MAQETNGKPVDASAAPPAVPKIRHEWYQTDNDVVLSVFLKNIQKDSLKIDIYDSSFSLNYKLPTGSDLVFDLEPLSHPIDPTASSFKVLSTKVEVKLVKKEKGLKWGKLEGEDQTLLNGTSINSPSIAKDRPSYPTSSAKKTDWNKLEAEVKKEEDSPSDNKDPNAGGDRELNALFQKLYSGATDEQRKAMIKSYQESNGTALSTNWDEVKTAPVETKPPDSMIARKWNE